MLGEQPILISSVSSEELDVAGAGRCWGTDYQFTDCPELDPDPDDTNIVIQIIEVIFGGLVDDPPPTNDCDQRYAKASDNNLVFDVNVAKKVVCRKNLCKDLDVPVRISGSCDVVDSNGNPIDP